MRLPVLLRPAGLSREAGGEGYESGSSVPGRALEMPFQGGIFCTALLLAAFEHLQRWLVTAATFLTNGHDAVFARRSAELLNLTPPAAIPAKRIAHPERC